MPLKPFLKVYKPTGVNGEAFFGINLLEFHLFLTHIPVFIQKFKMKSICGWKFILVTLQIGVDIKRQVES